MSKTDLETRTYSESELLPTMKLIGTVLEVCKVPADEAYAAMMLLSDKLAQKLGIEKMSIEEHDVN